MGHDEHFLRRLDRVQSEHLELALGLYRDHELVQYVLSHVRLPEGAERVALALADGGEGPHVVVARGGAFVTCLGQGMSTGALPVVSRAHVEALASKVERVREGLALAKKRGFDETRLLERIKAAGPAVAREDFVAASSMLGPAVPLLAGVYASCATQLEESYPLLLSARGGSAALMRVARREVGRAAWAMAHSSTILVNSASREWAIEWAKLGGHDKLSPWSLLVLQSAFPFVVRAAWLAARLGKPMFPSYRARFFAAADPLDLRDSGWGLLCMGLRHESLKGDALKALRSPPAPDGREPWVAREYAMFAELADIVTRKEAQLREEGLDLGRGFATIRLGNLPESSPYRFTERAQVPGDLVLPSLFDAWVDANNGERCTDVMLLGVVAASRAQAEDFYFPATVLHAMGEEDLAETGESLVAMRKTLRGVQTPVRHEPRPGRNDPCPCGSGKKYKRCHGR